MKIKIESMKTTHENEKFFAELESYIQLYNQKSSSISQGLSFYAEFAFRVNDASQKVSDFIMARDIEKNDSIKNINNGGSNNYNKNTNNDVFAGFSLLNPSTNTITNMDYNYHYNYQPNNNVKYYDNYPNNNQNKSTGYNVNTNQNSSSNQNSNQNVNVKTNQNYNQNPNQNQNYNQNPNQTYNQNQNYNNQNNNNNNQGFK